MKKLLLLSLALLSSIATFAYDFEVYGIYYNILSEDELTCEVTYLKGYNSYSGDIVIPSTVTSSGKTYSVTTIGRSAFEECSRMTSVVIPESVTSIGSYAFDGCTGLTSVEIPCSVTSIGGGAFRDCSRLTSVKIPNSVTEIGSFAFGNCSGLTSVDISNSVTTIKNSAFRSCSSLESFTGKFASEDHRCLIVDGVLNSFAPAGLTTYTIPNSVTSIGVQAFYDCTGLTSVVIPCSVTSIDYQAFAYCTGLTSVEIPNSVTTIGTSAFYCCNGLTSVEIPCSVTSIEYQAFASCTGLTSVTIENSDSKNITLGDDVFYDVPTNTCVLYVPLKTKNLYAAAAQWEAFKNIKYLVALADGESYTGNEDMVDLDIDVNYTRNFSSTDWQPLYVPFNMSYDEWSSHGTVAELACVHVYEDGKTAIEFVTVNSGELLPNVPYVIKPTETGEVTFTCTEKQIKTAPAEGTKYISCSSPRYIFKLFGNYQPISANTLAGYGDKEFNGAYVLTAESKFLHPNEGTELKPFRFYITREKNPNGYWSASARYNSRTASGDNADVIYFMVDGQVTGILSVSEDSTDDVKVYNLNGIQTRNPHNGVFIKNGKKVYIK